MTKGYCENMLTGPKNYNEVLSALSEIVENSNIPKLLEEYESVKKEAKDNDTACEKALKKYRNELTQFVLQKVKTDKKAEKAKAELDENIKKGIEIVATKESILNELPTFFITSY
jgi:inorganic triphosphatase YgiF